MLFLNVHPQMFVRRSFNAAYGTGRHGDCKFVPLTMMFCMSDMIKFPNQKTNRQVLILDIHSYIGPSLNEKTPSVNCHRVIQNLWICQPGFDSGPAGFESEIPKFLFAVRQLKKGARAG